MEQVMNALERQNIEIPVSSQEDDGRLSEHLRSAAVKMVRKDRSRGMKMACMVQDMDRTPDDYRTYAKSMDLIPLIRKERRYGEYGRPEHGPCTEGTYIAEKNEGDTRI